MITLSTKGRYATRILLYMAGVKGTQPLRKQEIAEAEDISADYVEQILTKLKAAGLVGSRRGRCGGFVLDRDPDRITVVDVVEATEGRISLAPCKEEGCSRISTCVTRAVWERASRALRQVFKETTIGDLVRDAEKIRAQRGPSYEI